MAALGRTLTWRVQGVEHYDAVLGTGPTRLSWLCGTGGSCPPHCTAVDRGIGADERDFDGEWVARLMRRFGYRAARGSTSYGGARPWCTFDGSWQVASLGVHGRGPRGPGRVAQRGAIWLAGARRSTRASVSPRGDRSWTLASWDAAQIPKPFSTVAIVIGAPIRVHGTSPETIAARLVDLQRALEETTVRATLLAR